MIPVSQEFLDMVNSNIRQQIEPIISVTGEDENGNVVNLEWRGNNIVDMSYKRQISPIGDELPYMELNWKEFYLGKLNSQNHPEKYNGIGQYMLCKLKFSQRISKSLTWSDLEEYAWGEVEEYTWGDLAKLDKDEVIELPSMFLAARPTLENQTISWQARDVLFFLNEDIKKCYAPGIPWQNPIRWLFLNEIGNFSRNIALANNLTFSEYRVNQFAGVWDTAVMQNWSIFEGATKDLLKNAASARGYYFDFANGFVNIKKMQDIASVGQKKPVFSFSKNIMRENAKLTRNKNISSFTIGRNSVMPDEKSENVYGILPSEFSTYMDADGNDFAYKRYIFDSYGISMLNQWSQRGADLEAYASGHSNSEDVVIPILNSRMDEFLQNTQNTSSGDAYIESNPVNYLTIQEQAAAKKFENLNAWYSANQYSIEVNSLSAVMLETGDLVGVETNLYNGENAITKTAIVVGIELEYNGTLKQKTLLHEVV